MSQPRISILVLNFNGRDVLEACVQAIEAQTFRDFELILVDNGSSDGSWDLMQVRWADTHRLVSTGENLGFAEGNNVGLAAARGRDIAILNNDTVVDPRWLEELVRAADTRPEHGMFASQIRILADPDRLDTIGIALYRDGMSRGSGHGDLVAHHLEAAEVFAPSGCGALFRRELIDRVGFFATDFFAYHEDVDLGFRARLAGFSCWYVPTSIVHHHGSLTAGRYSSFKAYLVERNHLYMRVRVFPKRMLVLSPLFTFWRYALQAVALVAGKGASGGFAKEAPATGLVGILFRAYRDTFLNLPALLRQRRAIMATRKVSSREIWGWFDRFPISARDLAFRS